MACGTHTLQSAKQKVYELIYEETEGPLSTPKTVKCLLRQRLVLAGRRASDIACPAWKDGQAVHGTCLDSPALLSIAHPGSPHHCHHLLLHPCHRCFGHSCDPSCHPQYCPHLPLQLQKQMLHLTLFSLLLPKALWHSMRGKAALSSNSGFASYWLCDLRRSPCPL